MENKYLDYWYDLVFGEEGQMKTDWDNLPMTFEPEEFDQFVRDLKKEGIEMITFQPDDPIDFIFEDGELKMVTYISTRGNLYQVGAYDGEKCYFRTNLTKMMDGKGSFRYMPDSWEEVPTRNICASIAKRFFSVIEDGWPKEGD